MDNFFVIVFFHFHFFKHLYSKNKLIMSNNKTKYTTFNEHFCFFLFYNLKSLKSNVSKEFHKIVYLSDRYKYTNGAIIVGKIQRRINQK